MKNENKKRLTIYDFAVYEITRCNCCGHEDAELVDACGGFFGDDFFKAENNDEVDA